MGIRLFGNSCGRAYEYSQDNNVLVATDPDPAKFRIQDIEQVGVFVVAIVHYPNCTNYGGDKVLVWKNTKVSRIKAMKLIDPHFLETDRNLIARFRPTTEGWAEAIAYAKFRSI